MDFEWYCLHAPGMMRGVGEVEKGIGVLGCRGEVVRGWEIEEGKLR